MKIYRVCACAVVSIMLAGCGGDSVRGRQSAGTQSEDLRSTFARLLYEERDREEEVQSAKDLAESYEMFDKWILPTLEDKSAERVDCLRRRLAEGRSWMYFVEYSYEHVVYRRYYYQNLYPELILGRYAFGCLISDFDVQRERFCPLDLDPLENHGFVELHPQGSDMNYWFTYEKMLERMPLLKWYQPSDYYDHKCDAVAIVDIVDVQLSEVSGFDSVRRSGGATFWGGTCWAVYKIQLMVREVENGSLGFDAFMIELRVPWSDYCRPGAWFYYRGMTMRVGLRRSDAMWLVSEASPTLPYPPYSEEGITVSGGAIEGADWDEKQKGRLSPLVVEYGQHTKVEYSCGDIVCQGASGSYADFGVTSKVKVLELKEGSNKKFWDRAWFIQKGDDSIGRQ